MPKKRKACDACFRRKIQCDLSGPGPKCNWCSHRDDPCTFDRIQSRPAGKKIKSNTLRKDIAERIERIESALAHAKLAQEKDQSSSETGPSPHSPSPGPTPPPPPNSGGDQEAPLSDVSVALSNAQPSLQGSSNATLGTVYFSGHCLGFINAQNSMPSISAQGQQWIFSATGGYASLPSFETIKSIDQEHHLACRTSTLRYHAGTDQYPNLPERKIVETVLALFFRSNMSHVFPLIDPVMAETTLNDAYSPSESTPSVDSRFAAACVFAFMAFASQHFGTCPETAEIDTDLCAVESQALGSSLLEDANLTALQSSVMLQMYHISSGRLQAGSICHGIACRTLFALGGHTLTISPLEGREPTMRERQDRLLRNLFWLIYIIDKEIALRTGSPPILLDEYCDLTLPEGYYQSRCLITEDDMVDTAALPPSLPGDIGLSILKSKTCRLLYSVEASRKSDGELLRSIRELDEELENWRSSIPEDFSSAMSVKLDHEKWDLTPNESIGDALRMRRSILNLEYYHLMTAIHSASGRCIKTLVNGQTRVVGLQSSLELSVEASRATIIYLRFAANSFPAGAFWFIIFYPMSALMTLFFNVLRDPLDANALRDIELIRSISEPLHVACSGRRLTQHDVKKIEQLETFVAELHRLGDCAIRRAQLAR